MPIVMTDQRGIVIRLPVAAALFAVVVASLALLGWYRHLHVLTEIFPSLPPIAPRIALTFVLAGLVLLGIEVSPSTTSVKRLCLIGACLIVLSGVLSLGQLVGIWSDTIDTTLGRIITRSAFPSLGPPVFMAAVAPLLLGGSLLAIVMGVGVEPYLSQALCLVGGTFGLATLYADIFGAALGYGPPVSAPFAGISLSGALAFWALCLGILARQPNRGFLGAITGQGPARALARTLLVLSIAAPFVLSALALLGVRFGLYDVPTAVAFAIIGSTLILGLLGLVVAHALNRLDAVRAAALRITDSLASASADPREILQTIVAEAQTVGGADYVALGIDGDVHLPFDPWVFTGMSAEQAVAIGHFPRPVGLLGAVVTGGATIRRGNLTRDARFRGFPAHHPPMHAFLGFPIYFHGRPVGNLYLTRRPGEVSFSAEEERVVGVLAGHAGAVLETSRLRALLAEEQARLQAVLDTVPVGIVFVEADTDRVLANAWATRLFGRSFVPEKGRAQYVQRLLDPQERPVLLEELPSTRALRGEKVQEVDFLLVRPDGSRMQIRESAAPLRDAGGRVTAAVFVVDDVTAQKQLERERTEWTSVIAHDLRQPVTVILGYAALLHGRLERLVGRQDDRRAAEHILTSAQILDRLIGDLLDISRIESRRLTIQRQRTELPDLIRAVLDRTERVTRGHLIRLEVGETIPPLQVDPARIEQVLGNLLSNAAKYSEPAAPIDLIIERREAEVEVAVSNSGPGIAPDEVPRLFQRFYRTREARAGERPGLGLGLYITKGLVEAHGGRISVESVPGQVTTFRFSLPVPS